jgi:hypothetical protein
MMLLRYRTASTRISKFQASISKILRYREGEGGAGGGFDIEGYNLRPSISKVLRIEATDIEGLNSRHRLGDIGSIDMEGHFLTSNIEGRTFDIVI